MSTAFDTQNCTNAPATTATDAGVAGAGVRILKILHPNERTRILAAQLNFRS
jgi:hypothetical protein